MVSLIEGSRCERTAVLEAALFCRAGNFPPMLARDSGIRSGSTQTSFSPKVMEFLVCVFAVYLINYLYDTYHSEKVLIYLYNI
jgi:hypothetical protein